MHQTHGADLRRLFGQLLVCRRLLGLSNRDAWQNCKARRGANPRPEFGGSKKVEVTASTALRFKPDGLAATVGIRYY